MGCNTVGQLGVGDHEPRTVRAASRNLIISEWYLAYGGCLMWWCVDL